MSSLMLECQWLLIPGLSIQICSFGWGEECCCNVIKFKKPPPNTCWQLKIKEVWLLYFHYRDKDAKIKEKYQDVGGNEPKDIRKRKMLRRIHEYKKFKENCQRLKQFIREKQEFEKNDYIEPEMKIELNRRTNSFTLNTDRFKTNGHWMRNCFSMPNLKQNLTLQETILLWRLKRDR